MKPAPQPLDLLDSEEQMNWLALRLVPGLGARVALRVLNAIGSATGVFRASPTELEGLGVPSHVVKNMAAGTVFEQAIREAEQARQTGVSFVTIRHPDYPQALKEIFDPPLLLYVRGDTSLLAGPGIGMVGTR